MTGADSWLAGTFRMRLQISVLVFGALLIGAAQARQSYVARIPNGQNVTNPCATSTVWRGVGHWSEAGGGDRNPFGVAFAANSYVWNATLCQLDSDGDKRTNGVELGDPNCVWVMGGSPPAITTGITHPGICEPVTSAHCKSLNSNKIPCGAPASVKSSFGVICGLLLAILMLR